MTQCTVVGQVFCIKRTGKNALSIRSSLEQEGVTINLQYFITVSRLAIHTVTLPFPLKACLVVQNANNTKSKNFKVPDR